MLIAGTNVEWPGIGDINQKLPGYRIDAQLGGGNMGVVFLAEELGLGRKVALKVLAPSLADDERFRRRFTRESQMAANLDHPHVVPIYSAGEVGGLLYIAMRYVDGPDLRTLIEAEGPFTLQRAAAVISQVAAALDAAHDDGLVHRDVKPANVLVDRGAGDHCYLCDFGVTKQTSSAEGLTAIGQFVGTIDYTAPEQIQGKPVDGRADVYALGCVLYQCLTGQVPFPREQDVAVLSAHLYEEPPSVTAHRPDLPPMVDLVVAKAMAKQPEQRYGTCGELAQALRVVPPSVHYGATVIQDGIGTRAPPGALPPPSWSPVANAPVSPPGEPVPAPSGETVGPGPRAKAGVSPQRRRWPVIAAVAVAAAVSLVVVTSLGQSSRPFTPDEQALLGAIPLQSRVGCERATDIGDFAGAAVGVRCQPGSAAQTASYYQFRDLASLQAAYGQRVSEAGAPDAFCGDVPPDFLGEGGYAVGGIETGRVLCHRSSDQKPLIEWTEERLLILVQAVGTDPKTLIDWWTNGAGPIPTDEQALRLAIPAGSRVNCLRAADVGDFPGATVGVRCGPTSGAREVAYYKFRDLASMQAVYDRDARFVGARPGGPHCVDLPPNFLGEGDWLIGDIRSGRVLCATVDGEPLIEWTHEQLLILAKGLGTDPNALVVWWSNEAGPE